MLDTNNSAKPSDQPAEKFAFLRRANHVLGVTPIIPILQSALSTYKLCTATACRNPVSLFSIDPGRDEMRTHFGLEPVVRRVLHQHGWKIHDLPPQGEPRPLRLQSTDFDSAFQPSDHALVDWLTKQPAGVIQIDPQHISIPGVTVQIAAAFPDRTVTLIATRLCDAQEFAKKIARHFPVSVLSSRSGSQSVNRVVVSTPSYLGACREYHDAKLPNGVRRGLDIVIAANAREILGQHARWCFQQVANAHRYAFLPINENITPYESDWLHSLFGFSTFNLLEHGKATRPIALFTSAICGGPRLAPLLDILSLKRSAIWRHPVRNRRIAKIARCIQFGKSNDLKDFVLHFPDPPLRPLNIGIVVENLEHAGAIQKKLPTWPVSSFNTDLSESANCALPSIVGNSRSRLGDSPCSAIITFQALQKWIFSELDVLIRADGGKGLLPLPSFIRSTPAQICAKPLFLIDFLDHHHPELRRWTRNRQAAYRSAEWLPSTADPIEIRVSKFINDRITGRLS